MKEPIISLCDLSKSFAVKKKEIKVLENITIEARPKEILAVMGPSGCGKSTLLKVIGGIENATSGTMKLFGEDCSKGVSKEIKRRLGFVYQNHNLLPWRSVEDNLRFPLEIFGLKKDEEYRKKIDEALEVVGLSDYRSVLPQELSGGMMQRVGIARALVFNPDVLLMDQPFGALDAITRKKLRFDFLNLFERTEKTIIIVTNSIDEALLFASRIYVLGGAPGKIEEVVEVDIPYEERTTEIAENVLFEELRKHMIDVVKKQYKTV